MKTNERLQIIECNNAIILPQRITDDGPRWGLGGVVNDKNEFVEDSFYDGGWAKHGGLYSWEKESYINDDAIYIGLYLPHWGHFLIDLMTRMWGVPKLTEANSNIKIAYIGEESFSGNCLQLIKALGVKDNQLMHVTKPVRFRKVYVPQQSFKSCEWYTDEHVQMLDLVIKTELSDCSDISEKFRKDRIYFSRRKFGKAIRSEFGEEYFESVFENNGYQILSPEEMSLKEQIYVWNNAKKIVCINGTIPLNVLFSLNEDLDLTILNKTSIKHDNPYILLKMRNIKTTFINIYKEPFEGFPKSLGEGPFLLWPTSEFSNYCTNKNLMQEMTAWQTNIVFRISELKYCWSIISPFKSVKDQVRKLIPHGIKEKLKELIGRP